MMNEKFNIEGMTCTACAAAVERAAGGLNGVDNAVVNFATEKLSVNYDPELVNVKDIEEAIQKIGYKAIPATNQEVASQTNLAEDNLKLIRNRIVYSLIFTIPLFDLSMGPMVGLPIPWFLSGEENLTVNALTQLLLCLPVLYIGAHFYIDGYKALWYRVPNMDSLIAVGTSASFIYSIYVFYNMLWAVSHGNTMMLHHFAHDVYFESTVVILTLISVGKYMEARAKGKTSQAIEKLIELAPDEATILQNGSEKVIPIEDVQIGDTIVIKPGDRIPVDGVVTSGNTTVDESLLTGESIPIEKSVDSTVIAGSINKTGSILFEASRIGEDTSLAKIINLVEEAQASKAPISKLADEISRYFVPTVMAISLTAFIVWMLLGYGFSFSLSVAIAVLVISCPCALGLATPTAIMVGTGVGAKDGILFKNGEALESLGKTQAIVFDKTGTLTIGQPKVTDIILTPGNNQKEVLKLAASLESRSEHSLSEAIIDKAYEENLKLLEVENFKAIVGKGVEGKVDGTDVLIGNERLMKEFKIPLNGMDQTAIDIADQGKTPLFVALNGKLAGIIAAADVLKDNVVEAINQLRAMNIEVYMLTGDNIRTAKAIAREVGIENVIAEVLPDQKAQIVKDIQEKGMNVTMVGDGINDAPALVQANNGIAIGNGTDVAIESADIILMQENLNKVPTSIQLSQSTLKNIKMNLFWAFFYNTICIPLAAGVLYIPFGIKLNAMVAAAAMSLSSFSVVMNALSLRFFKPKHYSKVESEYHLNVIEYNKSNSQFDFSEEEERVNDMEIKFKVDDMSCQHCVNRVKEVLMNQPGVLNAQVDLDKGEATIECEPGTNLDLIAQAVTDAGYPTVPLQQIVE